ncbi:NIPSNAP family protein [Allopusillimonas soli]|uniref:NIPSNAP family protein n=1 Tax=Allopusillimonas soli TaxID=659016 RepID=A0A853FMD2_9BURK|nr:NIPSNAP family protein [Allopusillimonas soli]NYT39056.1 NIPSNAP family protein [Allopusillimonas soli]TEA69512.1 NIPSNAP family protein [Allopusillimonas soli]
MIFELRTYTVAHGQMTSYLDRYEHQALPLLRKHLGRFLGFYVSEIGPLNQVLHIWAYEDLTDRQHRRAELDADPAWHAFKELNAGTFVHQEVKIMRDLPFSPQWL